jgi:hypothetical protein
MDIENKDILIKNTTEHTMHDIIEYLGAGDKRDAKLFGKLRFVFQEGAYYNTLVVCNKQKTLTKL